MRYVVLVTRQNGTAQVFGPFASDKRAARYADMAAGLAWVDHARVVLLQLAGDIRWYVRSADKLVKYYIDSNARVM